LPEIAQSERKLVIKENAVTDDTHGAKGARRHERERATAAK
jgi:hypothetical protein